MNNLQEYKIDKIFFETSYPVLFTCLNKQDELFLTVCCQNNENGRKWLLTKISEDNVIRLLSNKITIRTAFEQSSEKKLSILQNEKGYSIKEHTEDWDNCKRDLPAEGIFLDADDGEYDGEINYYKFRKERGIYKKVYTQLLISSLSEIDFNTRLEDIVLDSRSVEIASKIVEEIGEIKISDVEMFSQFQKSDEDWRADQRYTSVLNGQTNAFHRIEINCHEENISMSTAA